MNKYAVEHRNIFGEVRWQPRAGSFHRVYVWSWAKKEWLTAHFESDAVPAPVLYRFRWVAELIGKHYELTTLRHTFKPVKNA